MSNQPAKQFRLGFVSATVWLNGKFYTTVLSKVYKDNESGDWKNTDQLSTGDLLNAAKLLQRAEEFISAQ